MTKEEFEKEGLDSTKVFKVEAKLNKKGFSLDSELKNISSGEFLNIIGALVEDVSSRTNIPSKVFYLKLLSCLDN